MTDRTLKPEIVVSYIEMRLSIMLKQVVLPIPVRAGLEQLDQDVRLLKESLVARQKEERPYWLCCGSLDNRFHAPNCMEARAGHTNRCRWGTKEEHRLFAQEQKKKGDPSCSCLDPFTECDMRRNCALHRAYIPRADANGWVRWQGRCSMPVAWDTHVRARLRDGRELVLPARCFTWDYPLDSEYLWDVLAYKVEGL